MHKIDVKGIAALKVGCSAIPNSLVIANTMPASCVAAWGSKEATWPMFEKSKHVVSAVDAIPPSLQGRQDDSSHITKLPLSLENMACLCL